MHPDGRLRRVRRGTITHIPKEGFHHTKEVSGRTGCWTIGIDARWQGLSSPGYMIEGEFVPMWRYAEMRGAPADVIQAIKELTGYEQKRRVEA
jgi:hypothetical protein